MRRRSGYCWPWAHDWKITTGLSVPVWDISAQGILKRCKKCPKVVAK